ncbi:uncharacterized protein LOC107399299 [Tribolium castaneum]|uniref:uncharacterized protein LOC107399299 n=1 Tax=Tribolium castaneum TaxID=7070 RepID=UPI00077DBA23|nr:PREDICTED: uncharacterized protein LOC107399299 [Tribolium castaneum]|eukprot:XP_015840978.1 PREDICTED: uncharacterized protein LOC107399299 [Tribolium castaneum]
MPEMPSADMRTAVGTMNPVRGPEFNISSKDVEGLVLEIKENLRLSATTMTMKALPCSHLSRKSSRASPYRLPGKECCAGPAACEQCLRRSKRRLHQEAQEDPYELLQKLLRDGSLVNEAVRRVQLGLTPKQRYFYESDEESSPVLRLYSQES